MEKWLEGLEPVVERQELRVPYRYSMGATTSKFFTEIRDNKKIMGIRCSKCEMVYVPPRSTCGRCFSLLNDWIEVSDQGTLETYTQVRYATPVQPFSAPFFYGIIKLDGADTGLPHLIGETQGKEPSVGMRLQAVFKEERAGNMLDILYFKPIEEAKGARRKAKDLRKKGRGKKPKGQALKTKDAGQIGKGRRTKVEKRKVKGKKFKGKG